MTIEEAIEIGADECHCPPETMRAALYLMMPARIAGIIEQCAGVAKEWPRQEMGIAVSIAVAIRALKDKDQ